MTNVTGWPSSCSEGFKKNFPHIGYNCAPSGVRSSNRGVPEKSPRSSSSRHRGGKFSFIRADLVGLSGAETRICFRRLTLAWQTVTSAALCSGAVRAVSSSLLRPEQRCRRDLRRPQLLLRGSCSLGSNAE